VKEKTNAPAVTASDDDMDLLDDDKSPLIKDGSPPLTDMDINIVFMMSAEFRGAEFRRYDHMRDVAQLIICL
jgi:hypothetical protein